MKTTAPSINTSGAAHELIHPVPANHILCDVELRRRLFSNAIRLGWPAGTVCITEITKDICQNNKGDVYLSVLRQGDPQTSHQSYGHV